MYVSVMNLTKKFEAVFFTFPTLHHTPAFSPVTENRLRVSMQRSILEL